jgi:hypothetical protein
MKTAMQELFSKLEIDQPQLFNTNTLDGRKFINDYYKFFEMERQQFIQTFDIACEDENRIGIEYYNETFKKEQGL